MDGAGEAEAQVKWRGLPSPRFFVNVASKGVRFSVSALESTFADGSADVDSKEVTDVAENKKASKELALPDAGHNVN
jgi:hypothetical protein